MPITLRSSFAALIAVAALSASVASLAAETFDVSALPRPSATKDLYTGPTTAIYLTAAPLPDAAAAIRKSLAAEGWQEYGPAFAQKADNPTLIILSFKNGWRGLSVMIQPSPIEKNATSVNYTPVPLEKDLPFPKSASNIAYDPSRPYLNCRMPGPIAGAIEFFTSELTARGYTRNLDKGDLTDRGAHVFFLKDGVKSPMLLTLNTMQEGDLAATLELVPLEIMTGKKETATVPPPSPAPAPAQAPAAAAEPPSVNDIAAEITQQVQSEIRGLKLGEAAPQKPAATPPPPAPADEPAIGAEVGSKAPIPVPTTMSSLVHDAPSGTLTYTSTSSVSALASFYRKAMREAGWTELPTVLSRPNMSVVVFEKDGREASITLMQMGGKTSVRAIGSALESAAEATAGPASSPEAPKAKPLTTEVELEEKDGLPVPKDHTMMGLEKTMFRRELTATVAIDVASLREFYRRELTSRGWTEEPGAEQQPASALVKYASAAGSGTLRLTQDGGSTQISFKTRETAAAKKSGLMPQPGSTKILLGNVLESAADITVGTIAIKVKAGAGANGPNGPTLEIGPGTYTVTFKAQGIAPATETIEVKGDEIWGLMLGPGGILPIQMY